MKKIIQDQSKCLGCMACVGLNPELFSMDENGLAKLQEATAQGSVFSRQVDDSVDTDTLVSACCGGAISQE